MKHTRLILFFVASVSLFFSTSVKAQTVDPDYWDGKVYFQIKTSSPIELAEYHSSSSSPYSDPFFSALISKYSITDIFKPFPKLYSAELQNTYEIHFLDKDSVLLLIS